MVNMNFDISGLPEYCFVTLKSNHDEVVMVHRGQTGYSPTREGNEPWRGQETADLMNERLGINKAQARAMEMGSMFGWDVHGANPAIYDKETGLPKK